MIEHCVPEPTQMRLPPPPPGNPPPPPPTQQPPPLQELRAQHGWPGSPHAAQRLLLQRSVAPLHVRPVQHAWPAAPHGVPSGSVVVPLDPPLLLAPLDPLLPASLEPLLVPPSAPGVVPVELSSSLPHATIMRTTAEPTPMMALRSVMTQAYRDRSEDAFFRANGRQTAQRRWVETTHMPVGTCREFGHSRGTCYSAPHDDGGSQLRFGVGLRGRLLHRLHGRA